MSADLRSCGRTIGREHEPPSITRTLARDQILFRKGEPKAALYRVETGALSLFDPSWHGDGATIEFAVPGDLVALGFLDHHVSSARALVETTVTCLPLGDMDRLVKGDATAEARLAQAIEREFEARKASLIEAGRQSPLERVAAFLVSVSRSHQNEGRESNIIDEAWPCAVVADFLHMSVDQLASNLADLRERALIESVTPEGLRLRDVSALEELAAGALPPRVVDVPMVDDALDQLRVPPRVYRKQVSGGPTNAWIERTREAYRSRRKGARIAPDLPRAQGSLPSCRHQQEGLCPEPESRTGSLQAATGPAA